MAPLISIIIPVYNAQKYIEKCILSLINQSYSNIEIICVDDCSTDDSAKIIEKFVQQDKRVKMYSTETNGGPAVARNLGLENANGEYIMFCDNDDAYTEDMCKVMHETMQKEDVDIVTCQANIRHKKLDLGLAGYINNNPLGKIEFTINLKHLINVLMWNKIFKKSIIDKYDIRFPDGVDGEDDAFIFKYLAVSSKYYGLKDKLYDHLFHKMSYTNTRGRCRIKQKRFDKVRVIEEAYNFLIVNNIFEKNEKFFKNFIRLQLEYMFVYTSSILDNLKIIRLYNDFVKRTKVLDKKEYGFLNIYTTKGSLKKQLELINKCSW